MSESTVMRKRFNPRATQTLKGEVELIGSMGVSEC